MESDDHKTMEGTQAVLESLCSFSPTKTAAPRSQTVEQGSLGNFG